MKKLVLILMIIVTGIYSLNRTQGYLDIPVGENGLYLKGGTYHITTDENVQNSSFKSNKAYNIAGCVPGNYSHGIVMINDTGFVLQCNIKVDNIIFPFKSSLK